MIYVTRPAYAMSYMLGYDDIMSMREERKKEEGAEAFNLAAFHHDLLRHGTIPPAYVRHLNQQQYVMSAGSKRGAVGQPE